MKLCLIGSSRFLDRYQAANRRLTLAGHIVYTIATVSTGATLAEEEKTILDLVHLRKIQESDGVVLITDESRYVGFSTKREIQWAQMLSKMIFWNPEDVPGIFYGEPQ